MERRGRTEGTSDRSIPPRDGISSPRYARRERSDGSTYRRRSPDPDMGKRLLEFTPPGTTTSDRVSVRSRRHFRLAEANCSTHSARKRPRPGFRCSMCYAATIATTVMISTKLKTIPAHPDPPPTSTSSHSYSRFQSVEPRRYCLSTSFTSSSVSEWLIL